MKFEEIEMTLNKKDNDIHPLNAFRDKDGHGQRVSAYYLWFFRNLEKNRMIEKRQINILAEAARFHDIGKEFLSPELMEKRGEWTEYEYELGKQHCSLGSKYLINLSNSIKNTSNELFFHWAILFSLYHHERWDGQGYPDGLKREEIPIEIRALSIVDVYDALRQERCYKPAYSHLRCIEMIQAESGKSFDPKLVRIFVEHRRAIEKIKFE